MVLNQALRRVPRRGEEAGPRQSSPCVPSSASAAELRMTSVTDPGSSQTHPLCLRFPRSKGSDTDQRGMQRPPVPTAARCVDDVARPARTCTVRLSCSRAPGQLVACLSSACRGPDASDGMMRSRPDVRSPVCSCAERLRYSALLWEPSYLTSRVPVGQMRLARQPDTRRAGLVGQGPLRLFAMPARNGWAHVSLHVGEP